MKKFLFGFLGLGLLLTGCQKSEPDTPQAGSGAVPKIESVSINDGASDVALDIGHIDVVYDMPVILSDASKVSMNGLSLNVSVTNKRMRIEFGDLEKDNEYVLVIDAGAVVSRADGTPCNRATLSFATPKTPAGPGSGTTPDPDPDAPVYNPGEPGNYSPSLVTENPLPNAERVYEYMLSIYGSRTLSGAMAKVNWNLDEVNWVYKWTGKYPAMATFDYIHLPYSASGSWIDYGDIAPAKEWFEKGGIVSASWHWNVPVRNGSTEYTFNTNTTFKPSNVLKDGTWEKEVADADLKKMAGYLKQLQDEGIPVVWRPLHEAAGNIYTQWHSGAWFWWGSEGAKAYRDLWRYMFDFFKAEGLRNLIWVWTTQTSSEADVDYAFYPGDEYVDIVGKDIYNIWGASDIASIFNVVAHMAPNKMVTLSENGNVADMSAQWNAGAKWLYFMPWYDYDNDFSSGYAHAHASISWWSSSFANPSVVDLSELPSDLYE